MSRNPQIPQPPATTGNANGDRPEAESQPRKTTDPIDEAAEESFPASDPPTFTGSTATPSDGAK